MKLNQTKVKMDEMIDLYIGIYQIYSIKDQVFKSMIVYLDLR